VKKKGKEKEKRKKNQGKKIVLPPPCYMTRKKEGWKPVNPGKKNEKNGKEKKEGRRERPTIQ